MRGVTQEPELLSHDALIELAKRNPPPDRWYDEDFSGLRDPFVSLRESWLYKNKAAHAAVTEGLEQASRGEFSDNPPDLEADDALADQLDDRVRQQKHRHDQ
jgi:hypothetical protein